MAEVWQILFSPTGFVLVLVAIGTVIIDFALRPSMLSMFKRKTYTALRDANDAKLREAFDVCHRHKHTGIEAQDSSDSERNL